MNNNKNNNHEHPHDHHNRSVLREFGLNLDESVEIRVWDSNAEIRYIVLPERPEGTEQMTEEELAEIVTRDSMIGVSHVNPPKS